MSVDNASKDEYLDVSENMRTYINARFAQLTVFIAITAGLLNVMFSKDIVQSSNVTALLKTGGLLTVFVFWIMEERAADMFHHYKRRAIELEKALGYKQYIFRPERRLITATNAVRLFFATIGVFWLFALIFSSLLS